LFLAGVIPGILEVLFYWSTIFILCRVNPNLGPAAEKTSLREKFGSLRLTWPVILLFLLVIGGIYLGVFTPSEAGGIGAFGALVVGLSRRTLGWTRIKESLWETVRMAGMLIILLVGAFILMRFLAISRIEFVAADFIANLQVNRYIILIIIMIVYIVLGMFFDIMAVILLTVPIIYPTILALGFDPVWFGIILVRVAEVGFVTPPFGLNLFGLMGATNIPAGALYRGVIPFVIADICHITLLVAFPSISLFLPNMMS
jgi:tripartite ATP-independent transporter DctM subunit